jgi:O-acetyl-ADP-ribose deacetylase (regulator of RNase III)
MRIGTFVGSITAQALGAHAVVNASNPDVALGSGVSAAIAEACGGAAYQRELREELEQQFGEPLEPDDCLVTGSGRASAFRWVLHVPAVDYRAADPETGGPSGPSRIARCTRAALREADALAREHDLEGRLVLATPLLGAGAGGVGEVGSADAMLRATRAALEQGLVLAELRFTVLTPELARLVARAAERHGVPLVGD